MSKKNLTVFLVLLVLLATVAGLILYLSRHGALFVGDVWQDTPEKALEMEADHTLETKSALSVRTLLDKREIGDLAIMTFVSESDTLVTVTFATNDRGQYCVSGYSEEESLDDPTSFVLNGRNGPSILFPYAKSGSTVYGWCESSVLFTVNGIAPSTKTCRFECQGKTRSLNFWWISDFPSDSEPSVEYQT